MAINSATAGGSPPSSGGGATPASAAQGSLGMSPGTGAGGTPTTAGDSSQKGSDTTSTADKEVGKGCCGKGCKKEITGQCNAYQAECNASCQKAMTPYTNPCSSCGGSGAAGGGDSGGGGGGSGNDASGGVGYDVVPYELSFIFSTSLVTFGASSFITLPNGSISAVSFSSTGLLRFDSATYSEITEICISDTDMNGKDVKPVFDAMQVGDTILFSKKSDPDTYIILAPIRQFFYEDYRTIIVDYKSSSSGVFAEGDIVTFDISRVVTLVPAGATVVTACPYCDGTGLEGGGGGIEGLIMATYNGSAGFAGVKNIDIYGIVQPS